MIFRVYVYLPEGILIDKLLYVSMIFPIRGCLVSEDSTGESRGARRSHEGHLFGKTPGDWICGDCNDLAIIFPMENPRKGESVILFFGGCLSKSQDMKTGGR